MLSCPPYGSELAFPHFLEVARSFLLFNCFSALLLPDHPSQGICREEFRSSSLFCVELAAALGSSSCTFLFPDIADVNSVENFSSVLQLDHLNAF